MKFFLIVSAIFLLLFSPVWATDVDSSIQDEIDKLESQTDQFSWDFTLKTFSSCAAMDEVMNEVEVDFDVDTITQTLSNIGLASKPLFNPDPSIANESLIDYIKAFLLYHNYG